MLVRRLTLRSVPAFWQAGTKVEWLALAWVAIIFIPGPVAAADMANIAGTWTPRAGTGVYEVTQTGTKFHWESTVGESADGTVHGADLTVNWNGVHATGKVTQVDASKVPVRIDWSTGEQFVRSAVAPSNNSTITGEVVQNGIVIANAKVSATNVGTKAAVNTTTATDGNYLITNLSGGVYKVVVEADGFKKYTSGNIEVHDAQTARVDAAMKVAGPSIWESLLVSGAILASTAYLDDLQNKADDSDSDDQGQTFQRGTRDAHRDKDKDGRGDKDKNKGKERDKGEDRNSR